MGRWHNQVKPMISLGAFLVFLLVIAIVSTYIATIHHYLKQADEPNETPAAKPTTQNQTASHHTTVLHPAHAH